MYFPITVACTGHCFLCTVAGLYLTLIQAFRIINLPFDDHGSPNSRESSNFGKQDEKSILIISRVSHITHDIT